MTDDEKSLIWLLAELVAQHLPRSDEDKEQFWTEFISVNKEALMVLVQEGIMKEDFPEEKFGERWQRLYYARFVPNWQNILRYKK